MAPAILGLLFVLSLSSCRPKQTIFPPETLFACSAPPPDQVSPDLIAQVYLDATSSMKGFSKPESASEFVQFLQEIERAFTTGWKSPQLKYWKFGDGKKAITERPVYAVASKMAFYEDAPLSWKTRMDQVLRTASTGVLTVVITDLFQDESDEVAVVAALKDVTLNQRLSVGVLGVRAKFDGVVYDIGPGSRNTPYKGIRPFYAILVGRTVDILHYIKQLSALGGLEGDRHFLLLPPQIATLPVGASPPKITKTPVGMRLRSTSSSTCSYSRLEFAGSFSKNDSVVVLDHKWEAIAYTPEINFQKLPERYRTIRESEPERT